VFIEAKNDGGGGDNWTTGVISRAKLQSNHHQQQTNTSSFYRPDALPVAQPRTNWREQISYSLDLLTPSSPGVFQLCLWPLIAPGCIVEGCYASHRPSDASTLLPQHEMATITGNCSQLEALKQAYHFHPAAVTSYHHQHINKQFLCNQPDHLPAHQTTVSKHWKRLLQLNGSVKEPNISIYFFFPPITQQCSISDVLFTDGRGVSDFSVLKYY